MIFSSSNRSRSSSTCDRPKPIFPIAEYDEIVSIPMRNRDMLALVMPTFGVILGLVWTTHTLLTFWGAAQACKDGRKCGANLPSLEEVTAGLHWRIDHILHFLIDVIMFLALWKILYTQPKR
jgi:hypothetical protein